MRCIGKAIFLQLEKKAAAGRAVMAAQQTNPPGEVCPLGHSFPETKKVKHVP